MSEEPIQTSENEEVPKLLAGRYNLTSLIARGGMASVFLGEHVDLKRRVAIKVLQPPDDSEDTIDFDKRFRLEAQTLAALQHPNIVTLHDFGEVEDGRCFLAMEYVDGPRLSDLLKGNLMAPERVLTLLVQVCQALRYAHNQGVIHRDLKPSNLLVRQHPDGTEQVKVVDFGLVKLTDAEQTKTRAGLILGSPHCMSPEQVKGNEVDPTTDIYSIGVLFFRALTGKYPFHGPNSAATMMGHLTKPVPAFASINPNLDLPPGLEDVVRKCLEKEPSKRYQSIDDLLKALAGVVDFPADHMGTSSVVLSTLQQEFPSVVLRRDQSSWNPKIIVGVLLALGLIGVGAVLLSSGDSPTEEQVASAEQAAPAEAPAEVVQPAPEPAAPVNTVDVEALKELVKEELAAEAAAEAQKREEEAEERRRAEAASRARAARRSQRARPKPAAAPEPEPEPEPVKAETPPEEAKPAPAPEPAPEPEPEAPKEDYQGLPDDW